MKIQGMKAIFLVLAVLIFWNYVAWDICQTVQGKIDVTQYLEVVMFNYQKILFNNAICILSILLTTITNFKREEYLVRAKKRNFFIQIREIIKCTSLYSLFVMLIVIGAGKSIIEFNANSFWNIVKYGVAYWIINYGFCVFYYLIVSIKNKQIAFLIEGSIVLIILLTIHYYVFY